MTSTLYVPAFVAVAADQSNDFNVGLNTKKLGSVAPVEVICAVYVYIASVHTSTNAKSENVIDVVWAATPTL
jgi:hypothetical protein